MTEENMVEIPEDVKAEVIEKPSAEDAEKRGLSKAEIKKATELGILSPEKKEPKKEEVKEEPKEEKVDEKKEEPKVDKTRYELTPDQEQKLVEVFGPGTNVHGVYFGMKSQRARAQAAETARDAARLELKLKEQQLKEAQDRIDKALVGKNGESEDEIDPLDRPLTARQLKEMEEQRVKERESQESQLKEKAQKISLALSDQEAYAKEQYPDFEETLKAGEDLIKNLDKVEGVVKKKAILLIRQIQEAASRADEFSIDDYTASDLSYELGQLAKANLPVKAEPSGKPTERSNGGLTPEQTKRVVDNATRRGSSAALSGSGGRRVVSVEDITLEDAVKLSRNDPKAFDELRKKHPEKIRQLMRG